MAEAYLVAYDVADDSRRRKMADLLLSYGERIQASVFVVGAGKTQHAKLRRQVKALMSSADDSVIVCNLGPFDRYDDKCELLGAKKNLCLDRGCLVL